MDFETVAQHWANMARKSNSTKKGNAKRKAKKTTPKLPTGVVDPVAYKQYIAIRDSDALKLCEIETSDPNLTLNLRTTSYHLDKKIKHLPQDERDTINAKATAIRKLNGKMVAFKRKAFNVKQNGPYSMQESILDGKAAELLEYFGRFYSATEVHRIVTTEWGLEVNYTTIDNFRKRNFDRIKERQEEYKRDYSDVRLGHKRSRLDELQYLYTHRKTKYESTGSKEDYKLLLQTIEQIRKEVEGDKLTIDGHLSMDVERTVSLHIQNEVLKHVVINDIIVARLSARLGVDSRLLINKLHNSYYSKFTGFAMSGEDDLDTTPTYPSKFVYNFDDVQRDHKALKDKEEEFAQTIPILDDKKSEHLTDVKSILLEKIKQKKHQINESHDRVDSK